MSEPNVRRYLRTHRICYPPDYRQLAERGLSPRKIRSFVGCSLLRKLSLVFYGWEERLLAFLVGAVLLSALVFVLCAVHLDLIGRRSSLFSASRSFSTRCVWGLIDPAETGFRRCPAFGAGFLWSSSAPLPFSISLTLWLPNPARTACPITWASSRNTSGLTGSLGSPRTFTPAYRKASSCCFCGHSNTAGTRRPPWSIFHFSSLSCS